MAILVDIFTTFIVGQLTDTIQKNDTIESMQSSRPTSDVFINDIVDFFTHPNALRSTIILVLALLLAYWLSRFLAKAIVKVAQVISVRSDNEFDEARAVKLRQVETYLSIAVAIVRIVVVTVVGYFTWRLLSPLASENAAAANGVAAIGASAVFIVLAGQTIGPMLRDITAGSIMITEGWFNVGDYIKIEPYWEVAGVVERFTLRSTRIRALNGEVIWVHNQNITGVHVTPKGVRTLAVDIFMSDKDRGREAIQQIIDTIPRGKLMLAKPLKITNEVVYHDKLVQFTVVGQTAPGREWLIERIFVEELKALDPENTPKGEKLLVMEPLQRYADPEAEKRFRRAVRVAKDKHTDHN